jgi:hypothetical protein
MKDVPIDQAFDCLLDQSEQNSANLSSLLAVSSNLRSSFWTV